MNGVIDRDGEYSTFEKIQKAWDEMPFYKQVATTRAMQAACVNLSLDAAVSRFMYSGCFQHITEKRILKDTGEHYVYIWKHAWGEPFYVGSGKGDRWKQVSPKTRCDEFYTHLDRADCVVYKIIDGVDINTAKMYEKYLSFVLRLAGYQIVNGDFRIRDAEQAKDFVQRIENAETTKDVTKALTGILMDIPKGCDYRVTIKFTEEHGFDYFSRR